jgi:hypothetical protein
MKILKSFTEWLNKTGSENKKNKTNSFDYTPSKDWMAEIRKREAAEKKRLEKWRKELKQSMSTTKYNSNYTYSTLTGHLPGGITNSTITTTNLADSAITINGGPNGSMKVDVPLLVNGRDVMKELDEMRDALLLLKRDVDMESKYPRLKELKDEYERALAKYKTFEAIKESK